MKRNEVKQDYKWNLSDIFVNSTEFKTELASVNKEIANVLKYRGQLGVKEKCLELLRFTDSICKQIEKVYCYAMLNRDENLADNDAQANVQSAEAVYVTYSSYASFIIPELSSLDEKTLNSYINDSDFSDYDYMLKTIKKSKKHILSEKEEKLLALAGKTFGSFSNIFSSLNDVELPFPKISIDGKREQLTHAKYSLWLQSNNRDTRRKAYTGMYKTVQSFIQTLTSSYAASVNKDNFLAKARGYKSAIEKALFSNDVPEGVYTSLVQNVNKYVHLNHEYMGYRRDVLGFDKLGMYDLHMPIFEGADISCDYEKAFDMVVDGLKPLGEEYTKLLLTAKANRWIDVEETEGKRSGAYSCGVNGVHPYVLLNYTPTTHDIFTIAHELGHSMHSHYSSLNQPYAKADYVIFVAEVASTVNEVLLLKHLISVEKNPKVKKYLLSYYLDMFRTTVFRQTMFAEFEAAVHENEAKGKPITPQSLNKLYLKLNKKYHGSAVTIDKLIQYEWARIPHFYRAFYVYQYSTGLISAVSIANSILSGDSEAVKRYKSFLSAGGSKSPYEILKDAGVDLLTSSPYETAFSEFSASLAELKSL